MSRDTKNPLEMFPQIRKRRARTPAPLKAEVQRPGTKTATADGKNLNLEMKEFTAGMAGVLQTRWRQLLSGYKDAGAGEAIAGYTTRLYCVGGTRRLHLSLIDVGGS